uniref:Uncharacterized protein n=1 Tax=Mustela putorius furo TaxID=9669 RepID=M3Y7A6_MUSPF
SQKQDFILQHSSHQVILTNQITTHLSGALASQADLVSPADDLSLSEGTSGFSCVTAALGNTWSHSVNTRLILQSLGSDRRQILIAKSPLAPFTSFAYTIEKEGLVLQGQQRPQGHTMTVV